MDVQGRHEPRLPHVVTFYERDPITKPMDRHQMFPRQVNEVIIWVTREITQHNVEVLSRMAGLPSGLVGRFDRRNELSSRQIRYWVRAEASRGDDEGAVKECCEDERILERDSLVVETAVRKIC